MSEVTVDAEAIPDELKERDQWLFWNASSDKPRAPLASPAADYPASWTDPDEWLSFEEVVEGAEKVPEAGIGYVFANTNDDYARGLYGALDLDGCVAEVGTKDWVPSLDPFFDAGAYIERSPSGEGLHIPLAGFEPPEWWSDEHLSDEEHEGVEAYGSKFFTFTGDQIRGSGESVADTGEFVEDWLAEVYEELTGEDPRAADRRDHGDSPLSTTNRSRTPQDEYLTEEDVRGALDHISPDVEYSVWRDIGFALVDFFGDDHTALSVFTDWSRRGGKWDSDAEKQAERIINDASPGGDSTIATIIHHARNGGWEMPTPSGSLGTLSPQSDIDVDELNDDEPMDKQVWELWAEKRLSGEYTEFSVIPALALKYIARDRNLYDFDALDEDVEELPAKAHNRALSWVKSRWPERAGADFDDDEDVTARDYKSRFDAPVYTWEDVRYVYDESKEDGRYAAVRLLRANYEFLTPEDTENLHIYDDDLGIFDSTAKYEIGRELDQNLGKHYSQNEKREIIGRLKEKTVERTDLEAKQFEANYVCVKNGVLNLDTRDLEEHDPKYKFTTYLPVEYDPEAVPEETLRFLRDITKRTADVRTLLEMVGHTLLPSYDPAKFLVLFGEGANGKSTWLEVVRRFLNGNEKETSNAQSLTLQQVTDNRFGASNLVGKWANIGEDLPAKKIQDLGRLKDLTGGGETAVEPKGEDIFTFENRATMMFAANRPPVLPEHSTAVKRRLVPVHLPYEYDPDPDPDDEFEKMASKEDLVEKMGTPEEQSGLLNIVLDALDRLQEQQDVSLPESNEERLELYERHSDHIKAFRVDCLTNEEGRTLSKDDIYNAYTNFCNANDHTKADMRIFWKNLRQTTLNVTEKRLPEQSDGSRPRVLESVTFKDSGLQYAPEKYTDQGTDETDSDTDARDATAFNAEPISEAAESLTGYVTVTAEIVTVVDLGTDTDRTGQKAILKDETGVIDLVAWDDEMCARLADAGGEHVVVKNAEVTKYDGTHQLSPVAGLTEIEQIQAGVGYTPTPDSGDNQEISTAADGGTQAAKASDDSDTEPAEIEDSATTDSTDESDGDPGTAGQERTGNRDKVDQLVQMFRGFSKDQFSRAEAMSQVQSLADDLDHAEHLIDKAVDRGALRWTGDREGVKVLE